MQDKRCSMRDAIGRYVPDGASVVLGTALESLIPFAAGHEIIRQRCCDLTLITPVSDILFDQMIGAGCARRDQCKRTRKLFVMVWMPNGAEASKTKPPT